MKKPSVFIIDDDPSVRKGLKRVFSAAGIERKSFVSAEEFLHSQELGHPGCILLDVQMSGMTGPELQEKLIELEIFTPIVFLSAYGSVRLTAETMKKGAVDFLSKPPDAEEIISVVCHSFEKDRIMRENKSEVQNIRNKIHLLTPREYEVMTHVIAGILNKQIAAELNISIETVKIHRGRIMKKLEIVSLVELVRLCEKAGVSEAKVNHLYYPRSK